MTVPYPQLRGLKSGVTDLTGVGPEKCKVRVNEGSHVLLLFLTTIFNTSLTTVKTTVKLDGTRRKRMYGIKKFGVGELGVRKEKRKEKMDG